MFLGTQYYRPPFPERRFWADDFRRIRDAGLDAVQLWLCWGWIEPRPGEYLYADYDELIALADANGLKVVLSTIAEIHPFWLLREESDAWMIDHRGGKVVSGPRTECNVGITPGGCTDHPGVRRRIESFLRTTAGRYAGLGNLAGWDCWNENRWAVHAGGYVCYCPHTLAAFRDWLRGRYGSLEGIETAWRRRYASWEDVFPGRVGGRPYTDTVEFLRFLSDRAAAHMEFRAAAIRSADPVHPVLAHCAHPTTLHGREPWEQALCRGNDWDHARKLDGYGCSHFPFWGQALDPAGFGVRVESVRSAAGSKTLWVSELQGGSARSGFDVHRSVEAAAQQRWVWLGLARGAKAVLFWCWRDEVFGPESSGFGLSGHDGLAADRLAALRRAGDIVRRHRDLLDGYRPDPPEIGIFFAPDNYALEWAQKESSDLASRGVVGTALALERLGLPYCIVEDRHLDMLGALKILFMHSAFVVPEAAAARILDFVRAGGTVVVDSECDAFTPLGFYRYPGADRTFAHALGVCDEGRRPLDGKELRVAAGGRSFLLRGEAWRTPLVANDRMVLGRAVDGTILAVETRIGSGRAVALGILAAAAYATEMYGDFERWIDRLARSAGVQPAVEVRPRRGVQWRSGISANGARLLFLVTGTGGELRVDVPAGWVGKHGAADDLLGGRALKADVQGDRAILRVDCGDWGVAVCRFVGG